LDRDGVSTDGEPAVTDDYGQPYVQPYVQPYGPPVLAPRTNGFAIAALACGIGGFVVFPASIAAIVLGHIARREIAQTGEAGSGMATAGLVLGYVVTAIEALILVGFIVAVLFLASWQ
jgi:Domain of unknown function (DUF4190)